MEAKKDSSDEIKWIVARNDLLAYPDFNEEFKIHTNASDFQLGAFIRQKFKTISFDSRKVTDAQKSYTVTEKYLLIMIETLKQFRTILLGQILRIYTNNKNLKCKMLKIDRVLIWRLILEEYDQDIKYIQVDKNILADALSKFTINRNQETTQEPTYKSKLCQKLMTPNNYLKVFYLLILN